MAGSLHKIVTCVPMMVNYLIFQIRKENKTMANEITKTIENENEIITVSLDKKLINKFDRTFVQAGKSLKDLCTIAYDICGDDKTLRGMFQTHVVVDLGMSKTSCSQMLNSGYIYRKYPELEILSHTKVAELAPIKDEIIEFRAFVGKTAEDLDAMTQKGIRSLVKKYINGESIEETEDETATATGDTESTEDEEIILDDGKVETKTTEEYNEITSLKYLLADAEGVINGLVETYGDTFEIEDRELAKSLLKKIYETLHA